MAFDLSEASRLRKVMDLVLRHGGGHVLEHTGLRKPDVTAPERFVRDLEALGPTYVKLGQVLGARPDLLPLEYIQALQRLHAAVEPLEFPVVRDVLEQEWGHPPEEVLTFLDPEPVGAASLGQVHRGALRGGWQVAVKVQRPGVRELVSSDLGALSRITMLLDRHTGLGNRVHFSDLLRSFRDTLLLELDFRIEADNLQRIGEAVGRFDRLSVPRAVRHLSTERVLVMDFVEGTALDDLRCAPGDGTELAEQLAEAYLEQIMVHGVFHADPHPGNLILDDEGLLHLIDLGMVERLDPRIRSRVAQLLLAVSGQAGHRAAEVLMSMTTALDDADPDRFRRGVSAAVKRSAAKEGVRFGMGETIFDLVKLCTESGYRPPPELAVLGKTLSHLDEVGVRLDPTLDPARIVQRKASELVARSASQNVDLTTLLGRTIETTELLDRLPTRLSAILDQLAHGRFRVRADLFDEVEIFSHLQKIANRIAAGIVIAGMLLSASWMMDAPGGARILGYPALAMGFFVVAFACSLALVASVLWHDVLHMRRR